VTWRRNTATALLILAAMAVPLAARQTPTFRSQVEAVEVDVRVTTGDGRPVADLTAADFDVREDGKRQTITAVTFVRAGSSRAVSGIPAGGPPVIDPAGNGRAYVIVLDDLHVNPQWSSRVKTLATQFIERNVRPGDQVALRTTGGGSAVETFTDDHAVLVRSLSRFIGQKLPAASLEQSDRRARSNELGAWTSTDDPFERERALRARSAMATLGEAALSLRELRGRRKAILFFSEGIDYDITDGVGRADKGSEADGIVDAMRQAMAVANQTNASFYAIDPRGGAQNAADLTVGSNVDREATDAMRRELQLAQSSLREVAEVTGGLAAISANNLTSFFDRIVEDSDSYYMLSYTPAADRKAGFHKLDVRVNRRGLRVRGRPGYTSGPDTRMATAPRSDAATPVAAPRVEAPAPIAADTAAPAVVAPGSPPPAAAAERSPDPIPDASLPEVLARVADYITEYSAKLVGIVSEERYAQNVSSVSGAVRGRIGTTGAQRDLRSDILLVRPAGEDNWVQFRDVFEVDGRAVRDRDERLYKLFVEPTPAKRRQADVIQEEGARYNIGPLTRTVNLPILALAFLSAENQPSFRYRRVKGDDLKSLAALADEAEIWVIEYRENVKGTLIRGPGNRDIPSHGRAWIEAATGRVLRTELMSEDVEVKSAITVRYQAESGFDLLVPGEMREQYTLPQLGVRIDGRATYNRFRRFTVTTTERPKKQ
jgi:VWFA-related protein